MSAMRFAYWKICMIYAIEIKLAINVLSEHNVQNIFQLFRYKIQFHIIFTIANEYFVHNFYSLN